MSDRHVRLLRHAAKAARARLVADGEDVPVRGSADARRRRDLTRRAVRTEAQLRDAQVRRGLPAPAPSPHAAGPAGPAHGDHRALAPAVAAALVRGRDGVLRLKGDDGR